MEKKEESRGFLHLLTRRENLLIMKQLILFLLWFSFNAHSVTLGQKIEVFRVDNANLETCLKKVESLVKCGFFYNGKEVRQVKGISVDMRQVELEELLTEIMKNSGFTFKIIENVIVVRKADEKKEVQENLRTVKVSGIVTDEKGQTLPGVSVFVKGSTLGVATAIDGGYTLEVPDKPGVILVFSYIGMLTKEVPFTGKTRVDVTLLPELEELEEVVVVGYGTQRKVNLTGAVSVVGKKELDSRPISNVSSGIQGLLPGVTVKGYSGKPGNATGNIRIRGIGTLNISSPLILIDGVEGNMDLLNPNDIESISVLKDAASSSIYGARGANGVILVTTKNPVKGERPVISYSYNFGIQKPTELPEMLDAPAYMRMQTEAEMNVNAPITYSEADIQTVLEGSDPNYWANTNWIDEIYKKHAFQQQHNFSINGGGKSLGYYISYGYLNQDGLMTGDMYSSARHNIMAKLNTELLDIVNVDLNMSYVDQDNMAPQGGDGLFNTALQTSPLTPVRFTDGQWGYGGSSSNPVAKATDGGFENYKRELFNVTGTLSVELLKGLTAKVQYGIRSSNSARNILTRKLWYYYPDSDVVWYKGQEKSEIDQRSYRQFYQNTVAQLDYDLHLGKHYFHLLGGFSQEVFRNDFLSGKRKELVAESIPVLDAGTVEQTNSGNAYHWALRSYFARVNYAFNDRYLLEFNMRYDGSSRFYKDNRWGFFPSVSVGWRLSEETFMNWSRKFVDNAKLRVSYGTLGNQYVNDSYYPYISEIESRSDGFPFGGEQSSYMAQTTLPNKNLKWETVYMLNAGIDLTLFGNRLDLTFEYFDKKTEGILVKVPLPDVIGLSEPYQNAGKVKNKGWEFSVAWKDRIKDFTYGLGFNISDVKNEVTDLGGVPPTYGDQIRMVGYPIDAFYGLVADGLAGMDEFAYDYASRKYVNPSCPVLEADKAYFGPGDIKYKDLSGPEGVPDGKIDLDHDRVVIGNSIPRYNYGITGNLGWKGIDFSFFLQGVGKCDGYIKGAGRHAFMDGNYHPQKIHLDRWSYENPDPKASYPRFTFKQNHNGRLSSFWIEDASYLRLKNVQLGYSFSKQWLKKLRVEKLRIYFSGDNLLTFTDFLESYDPETPVSSGNTYPQIKTYSFGVNVTLK